MISPMTLLVLGNSCDDYRTPRFHRNASFLAAFLRLIDGRPCRCALRNTCIAASTALKNSLRSECMRMSPKRTRKGKEGRGGKRERERAKDKIKRIALSVYNLQAKRLIIKLIKPIRLSLSFSSRFFPRPSFPFNFILRRRR